jgi:fluoride exporter
MGEAPEGSRVPYRERSRHDRAKQGWAAMTDGPKNAGVKLYLWVAFGSAVGGVARYALTAFTAERISGAFPWGTLLVNVLGSFLIGLVAGCPGDRIDPTARIFITVGVLGGFTTFSTFSLQTVDLFTHGRILSALTYVSVSALSCPLVAWLGWRATSTAS